MTSKWPDSGAVGRAYSLIEELIGDEDPMNPILDDEDLLERVSEMWPDSVAELEACGTRAIRLALAQWQLNRA